MLTPAVGMAQGLVLQGSVLTMTVALATITYRLVEISAIRPGNALCRHVAQMLVASPLCIWFHSGPKCARKAPTLTQSVGTVERGGPVAHGDCSDRKRSGVGMNHAL
jgi:hypothetical protein